jgi:hypothetical protein
LRRTQMRCLGWATKYQVDDVEMLILNNAVNLSGLYHNCSRNRFIYLFLNCNCSVIRKLENMKSS